MAPRTDKKPSRSPQQDFKVNTKSNRIRFLCNKKLQVMSDRNLIHPAQLERLNHQDNIHLNQIFQYHIEKVQLITIEFKFKKTLIFKKQSQHVILGGNETEDLLNQKMTIVYHKFNNCSRQNNKFLFHTGSKPKSRLRLN